MLKSGVTYAVIAMQDIKPVPGQFDVISSMALHYIDDSPPWKTMAESLDGGSFLFSIDTRYLSPALVDAPVSGSIGRWTAICDGERRCIVRCGCRSRQSIPFRSRWGLCRCHRG